MSDKKRPISVRWERQTRERVSKNWDAIRQCVARSYADNIDTCAISNILSMLMREKLTCWLLIGKLEENGNDKVLGCAITEIFNSPYVGKRLFFVVLDVAPGVPIALHRESHERLVAYAKDQGCRAIDFQTSSEAAQKLGEMMGYSRISVNMSMNLQER